MSPNHLGEVAIDGTKEQGPLPPLLLALTVVTGVVDAVSILRLGRVFVANMTTVLTMTLTGIAADCARHGHGACPGLGHGGCSRWSTMFAGVRGRGST